jgi:hypothetical protein
MKTAFEPKDHTIRAVDSLASAEAVRAPIEIQDAAAWQRTWAATLSSQAGSVWAPMAIR